MFVDAASRQNLSQHFSKFPKNMRKSGEKQIFVLFGVVDY